MAKVSKKKPLGRGLSSLLGENLIVENLTNTNAKNNLSFIPIEHLSPGSWQVRKNFDENDINGFKKVLFQMVDIKNQKKFNEIN